MRKEIIKETDYQNVDRPLNRFNQFFDILKHRFLELIKISLLQTVFNMPLICTIIIFYVALRNSKDINSLMTIFLVLGGSMLIALPFTYVGMTGSFYCLKKLAHAEGEFAASSYFIGLKENYKSGLFIGFLMGISACIAIIGFFFLYFYLGQFDKWISGFGIAIVAIQFIVMLMVSFHSISQVELYSNKMRYVYKNSFLLTLVRFPIDLLLVILYPGIIIALFCIMEVTMFVGIGLLVFFSIIGQLMWAMLTIHVFDLFINKEQYPEIYRKGLKTIEVVKNKED